MRMEHTAEQETRSLQLIKSRTDYHSLTGKPAPDILADFAFNEEGDEKSPMSAGHAPKSLFLI